MSECRRCRWYEIEFEADVAPDQRERGKCRRYAPREVGGFDSLSGDPLCHKWPRVYGDDYCGEFVGRETAKLEVVKTERPRPDEARLDEPNGAEATLDAVNLGQPRVREARLQEPNGKEAKPEDSSPGHGKPRGRYQSPHHKRMMRTRSDSLPTA